MIVNSSVYADLIYIDRLVFRLQIEEYVETNWNILLASDSNRVKQLAYCYYS